MIPKRIHYCWFGGAPLSQLAIKCIESWKKYCPDYEIIEWNESNFDINCCDYAREAYDAKKWAFVSDVARLYALVNYGGIYMDTDVEVLRPLDNFLHYDALSGFESKERVSTGLMACQKGQRLFEELLHDYSRAHFLKEDGSYDYTTNVERITKICLKYGLCLDNTMQTVNGFTLFPRDFFCPKDYITRITTLTQNTYAIHHFDGSWLSEEDRYAAEICRKFIKVLPRKEAGYLAKFFAVVKFRGIKKGMFEIICWIQRKKEKYQKYRHL